MRVLKVLMQFLKFCALPESRSLVCSEGAQNHRSHIFERNSKLYQHVWLILTPLFGDLTVEEEMYGHLMVDSAISHTVNSSVAAIEGMLVMQLIMHSLWPLRFRTE
jgi:hypothetical protein